jgi:hypothetical protein
MGPPDTVIDQLQADAKPAASYPPVTIILGTGRSGTEYLVHLMRTVFEIGFPAEPKFIQDFHSQLKQQGQLNDIRDMELWAEKIAATRSINHLRALREREISARDILDRAIYGNTYSSLLYGFLALVAEVRDGTANLGYKDPKDVEAMPLLLSLFPSAKVINIVRDGRDVASSFRRFPWGPNNHYMAAKYWQRAVDKSRRDGARAGDRYLELRYEDLILDSEAVTEQLVGFMDHLPIARERQQQFLDMVNETKQQSSINRWRHDTSERDLRIFESVAHPTLSALGYELQFSEHAQFGAVADVRFRIDDLSRKLLKYLAKPKILARALKPL